MVFDEVPPHELLNKAKHLSIKGTVHNLIANELTPEKATITGLHASH